MSALAELWQHVRKRSTLVLVAIGLTNAFIVISPALWSGYSWDDNVVSTLRGAVRESGTGLLSVMGSGIRDLFFNQGRLFPLSAIATVPLYFFDRFAYKASIVTLVLVNLILFGKLAGKIAGDRTLFGLALVLSPTVFQMRYGPDALHGYHWVLQLVHLWTTLSLLAFVSFLERRGGLLLVSSLLCFECALLTYEVAYAFFIFFAFLAVALRQPAESPLVALRRAVPFAALVVITAAGVFVARNLAGMPLAGVNGAYIPSGDIGSFASTVARHTSAAIPATYTLFSPLRSVENVDAASIWAAVKGGSGLLYVWIVASQVGALLLYRATRSTALDRQRLATLAGFGVLLWIAPGLLIALSPKYQARNWIDWGMSYLPVYLSFFGIIAMLAAAVATVRRRAVLCIVALLTATAAVWTYESNAQVVQRINSVFRFPREFAEQALRNGAFDAVPPGSYLIVGTDAFPGANPSFFRTHADVPLRRVVGKGNFHGGRLNDPSYFARLFNPTGRADVPLPGRVETADGIGLHRFNAGDNVYYFSFAKAGERGGYGLTARLLQLTASDAELHAAGADEVIINLSADWPQDAQLELVVVAGDRRQTINVPGDHQPFRTSKLGRLFKLAAAEGEIIDVLNVSVRSPAVPGGI